MDCSQRGLSITYVVGGPNIPTIQEFNRGGPVTAGRFTTYPDVRDLVFEGSQLLALSGGDPGNIYPVGALPMPAVVENLPAGAEAFTAASGGYMLAFSTTTNNLQFWPPMGTSGAAYSPAAQAFHDVVLVNNNFYVVTSPAFGVYYVPLIMPQFAAYSIPLVGALGTSVYEDNKVLVANGTQVYLVDPALGSATPWTAHADVTNPVAVDHTPDNTVLVLNGSPARVVEFTHCGAYLATYDLSAVVAGPRTIASTTP